MTFKPLVTTAIAMGRPSAAACCTSQGAKSQPLDRRGWNIGRHPRRKKQFPSHLAMFPELYVGCSEAGALMNPAGLSNTYPMYRLFDNVCWHVHTAYSPIQSTLQHVRGAIHEPFSAIDTSFQDSKQRPNPIKARQRIRPMSSSAVLTEA